jgi:hypothetical protein
MPRTVILLRVGATDLAGATELLALARKSGAYPRWKGVRDLLDAALTRGLDDLRVELSEAVEYEERHGGADTDDETR